MKRTNSELSMLSVLTDEQAQVLTWRFRDGFTQEQIAEVLGVCQQTVSNIIREAFDSLRQKHATGGFHVEFV